MLLFKFGVFVSVLVLIDVAAAAAAAVARKTKHLKKANHAFLSMDHESHQVTKHSKKNAPPEKDDPDVVDAAGVLGSDIDLLSNAGRDLTKEEFNGLCRHFLLVSPKGDKVAPSKFFKKPIITLGISPADAETVCAVWIHALEVAARGGGDDDGDDDGDDGTKKVRRDLEIVRNDRKLKQCDSSGPLPEYEPAQDPHLGPNPLNNMHGDSGLSDTTNYNAPTPNGKDYDNTNTTILRYIKTQSQCYTTAFNSAADRIVLLCHTIPYLDCLQKSAACTKVTGTVLILANRTNTISCWSDPECDPIEVLDTINLTGKGRAAGIYFYVNNNDIAVVANDKFLDFYDVGSSTTELKSSKSIDLTKYMVSDTDEISSAFPGWNGLIWFTTNAGKVGTYNPETNQIGVWTPPGGINLDLCPSVNCPTGIVKGIAVDATGTYVMTNSILVKFAAGHGNNNNTIDEGPGGTPKLVWSYPYDRGSAMYNCTAPGCGAEFGKPTGMKPGMQSWGSGTSPKLFGGTNDEGLVAIANNADSQIAVNAFNRTDGSLICSASIYGKGTSATTTSFVGYENSLFGVNNYGMKPGVSGASSPGFIRMDVNGKDDCKVVWKKNDQTNTGCLKLSTQTGIVYNNVNSKSLQLIAVEKSAKIALRTAGRQDLIPIIDDLGNMLSDNFVLGRDQKNGCQRYEYNINNGPQFLGFQIGELNGWTFFVSNQIGPMGELYVGTFNAMKVLWSPPSSS